MLLITLSLEGLRDNNALPLGILLITLSHWGEAGVRAYTFSRRYLFLAPSPVGRAVTYLTHQL
jgi:hypothetical protein